MLEGKTAVVTGGIWEMMEPIINAIPLGRMGQPEKISSAFLFLSSDMPAYITEAVLSADGAAMT